ncbi:MAG: T9SS type A sorting domain-containing protein, partial [Bacteroidales bacterium]|nr:T9SS type A sorting domain-containing protein [Bacteroidales bacterium]
LLPGQIYTVSSFEPAGWTEAAEGHHTLVFWLAEANGTALAETAIVKHRKILSKLAPATVTTYPYRPLVEEFSSSSCNACASRNRTLQPIFDALADSISVLKYQMNFPGSGDPYYTGEGGQRRLFYNVLDIPAICLDGKKESGSGTNKLLAALREKIQSPAYLDLAFDTLALDADTNVYVVLKVRSSVPMDGVLQTVVLEGQTENNAATNGETSFHHVMLKMLPGADGLPVSLAPDTVYMFRFAYDMKKTFMEEADDLKVVCFLQAYGDTVLQSALGDVTMRIQAVPDLANERTEGYTRLAVYPNPASEAVVLPALDRATVEVFNMAGRRVFHRYGVQGDYRLDVRDFRPGIYVIRVVEAGRTAWAKISVVR